MIFNLKKKKEVKITESELIQKAQQIVQENPLDCYCTFVKDRNMESLAMIVHSNVRLVRIDLLDLYNNQSTAQAVLNEGSAKITHFDIARTDCGYGNLLIKELLYQSQMKHVTHFEGTFVINGKNTGRILHFFEKAGFTANYNKETNKLVIQK